MNDHEKKRDRDEQDRVRTLGDWRAELRAFDEAIASSDMAELIEHARVIRERLARAGVGGVRVPVPFVHPAIAGGHVAAVGRMPAQRPLRFEHLVVTAEVAAAFEVLDFKIGHRSQVENAEPLPLEPFALRGDHELCEVMRWTVDDSCLPGMIPQLCVRNRTGGARRFAAIFWARVVDGGYE